MSNEATTPLTIEAINELVSRVGAVERHPSPWSRGDIKLHYGASADLPTNWWPCDGTTAPDGVVTPDLRGRAPFGLKAGDASFDTLGETGGAATHAHTGAPHDHTISHDHGITDVSGPVGSGGGAGGVDDVNNDSPADTTMADDQHEHIIDVAAASGVSGAAAYTGSTGNAATLPPYAVVNFAYRWA
jgi:hypothetical protein